jgi:glycine cleavage system aminomethyltransferase T
MATFPFSDLRGLPYYDEPTLYLIMGDRPWAWEFNGWKPESMSWKTGCYIHGGLSGLEFAFEGPDIVPFFSSICVNSFARYPVGSMKHAIFCTEEGLIATHGILQRNGEEEVRFFAAGPWPVYQLKQTSYKVEARPVSRYLFQVAGPASLATLEAAIGESLRDIGFLRFRNARINGKAVEVARIGMSGNLAYELRGPLGEGPEVYDAVYRAGQDLGIERLGWRAYLVNHVEGGFPQVNWTFASAAEEDQGFREAFGNAQLLLSVTGSVDPADRRARYRTPVEVGWQRAVRFDHDFAGRAALEDEVAGPRRTVVTLRWNPDDVLDIYASLLRPGQEYATIDLPTSPTWLRGVLAHADHILKDGRPVGVSSGTIYSYYFREVLSMGCIDVGLARPGTEVIVQWGDHGKPIKDVRATVQRFPYLTEGRNDQIDTNKLAGALGVTR